MDLYQCMLGAGLTQIELAVSTYAFEFVNTFVKKGVCSAELPSTLQDVWPKDDCTHRTRTRLDDEAMIWSELPQEMAALFWRLSNR
jgi:hypothetical protein